MLFRLVHYLPTAHLALAALAWLGAAWVMGAALVETPHHGVDHLGTLGAIGRWLAVLYLGLAGVLQYRLSRYGHRILAQPGRMWIALVAEQLLLLVILCAVLLRGPTSRMYLAGLHHAVAVLLVVAALTLLLAAIDRLAAWSVARSAPEIKGEVESSGTRLSASFVISAALLFLLIGFLEAQPLPHSEAPQPSEALPLEAPPAGAE